MDHTRLSRELVRALRGRRSQPALCRRIGLRSNLVYRWESGRASPSASQFFRICRISGRPASPRVSQFIAGGEELELETTAGVARLLALLFEPLGVSQVAARVGRSRFVVSRWSKGQTEIRLPDLLRCIDATTQRLPDFVSLFVDPSRLPSIARDWARIEAARKAAYEVPWSHAVLRALEARSSVEIAAPAAEQLARSLGIEAAEVRRALRLLTASGQLRKSGRRYRVRELPLVDTSIDLERRRALRAFWSRVAVERLERGTPGVHAFNLFTVAERDLAKLRALHAEFFERLRALVAGSQPPERVVLYSGQLVALDEPAPND